MLRPATAAPRTLARTLPVAATALANAAVDHCFLEASERRAVAGAASRGRKPLDTRGWDLAAPFLQTWSCAASVPQFTSDEKQQGVKHDYTLLIAITVPAFWAAWYVHSHFARPVLSECPVLSPTMGLPEPKF